MTTAIEHLGVDPGNAACVPGAHTKEPWSHEYRKGFDGMYRHEVFDSIGNTIAVLAWHPVKADDGSATTDRQANGRRIVACVNACAGIPTGALEAAGQSAVIALRPVDELVAERNALLAALEKIRRNASLGSSVLAQDLKSMAEAAIAGVRP